MIDDLIYFVVIVISKQMTILKNCISTFIKLSLKTYFINEKAVFLI